MKITKIEKACKTKNEIFRIEALSDEGAWRGTFIGTSDAVFSLDDGFPDINPMDYLNIFGISEKEQQKWRIGSTETTAPIYAGSFPGEIPVYERALKVADADGAWYIFRTAKGERLFAPAKYLEVFKGMANVFFYLREQEGRRYLAVKEGFNLEAVIGVLTEESPELKEIERLIRSVFGKGEQNAEC